MIQSHYTIIVAKRIYDNYILNNYIHIYCILVLGNDYHF